VDGGDARGRGGAWLEGRCAHRVPGLACAVGNGRTHRPAGADTTTLWDKSCSGAAWAGQEGINLNDETRGCAAVRVRARGDVFSLRFFLLERNENCMLVLASLTEQQICKSCIIKKKSCKSCARVLLGDVREHSKQRTV